MLSSVNAGLLRAAIGAASVCPESISKGTGLHSLRHYFPTRLILDGASVKRYAFGNSSRTITLNTYLGEWPDTDHHTLDR